MTQTIIGSFINLIFFLKWQTVYHRMESEGQMLERVKARGCGSLSAWGSLSTCASLLVKLSFSCYVLASKSTETAGFSPCRCGNNLWPYEEGGSPAPVRYVTPRQVPAVTRPAEDTQTLKDFAVVRRKWKHSEDYISGGF